jgi:hypothetical protein
MGIAFRGFLGYTDFALIYAFYLTSRLSGRGQEVRNGGDEHHSGDNVFAARGAEAGHRFCGFLEVALSN